MVLSEFYGKLKLRVLKPIARYTTCLHSVTAEAEKNRIFFKDQMKAIVFTREKDSRLHYLKYVFRNKTKQKHRDRCVFIHIDILSIFNVKTQ